MEDSEIDTLIEVAVDRFWAAVAEGAKEHTKNGDLSTFVAVRFRNAAEAAIKAWVRTNVEDAEQKIKTLRREAAAKGNWITVNVCTAALEGDAEAIKAVWRILDHAPEQGNGCCCKEDGHKGACCPGWIHCDSPYEIECCDECAARVGFITKKSATSSGGAHDDSAAEAKHAEDCGCDWGKCPNCDQHQIHARDELSSDDGLLVHCDVCDATFPVAVPPPRCPDCSCSAPMHECQSSLNGEAGDRDCWHCNRPNCAGHRSTRL